MTSDLVALGAFLLLCLGVSGLGATITASSVGDWYQTLRKPGFNPPDWVFAPVWTVLFVLMAVAAWRVWRRVGFGRARAAFTAFALQLTLNLLWSWLFFGQQQIALALAEIVLLLAAILVTGFLFWHHDRLAAALLVPYASWVGFAVVLNAALWRLN